MENTKTLISSKTFQIAAVQALVGVIVVFSTAYPEAGWLMMAKSVLDIALRVMTGQPIVGVMKK